MSNVDVIKEIAKRVWPAAEHIDVAPGATGNTGLNDPDPEGFRLIAIHADGSIMGQEMAASLEELEKKVIGRLRGKAKM